MLDHRKLVVLRAVDSINEQPLVGRIAIGFALAILLSLARHFGILPRRH
jgi:hypothetical protein